jgi:hypothetical protein
MKEKHVTFSLTFNCQRNMYSRCLRTDGGSITPKKDATLTFMDDVV